MEYTVPQLEAFAETLSEINDYDNQTDIASNNTRYEGKDAVNSLRKMGLLGGTTGGDK